MTTSVKISAGGTTVCGCTHTVLVVLAEEYYGKLPQGGHVGSFEDLALVGGTVPVGSDGDPAIVVVFVGEAEPGPEGNLGANDPVTAVEVVLGVVQVHGATLTAGAASLFTCVHGKYEYK